MDDLLTFGKLVFPSVRSTDWKTPPKLTQNSGAYLFSPGGRDHVGRVRGDYVDIQCSYLAESEDLQSMILFFVAVGGRFKSFYCPYPQPIGQSCTWLDNTSVLFESTFSPLDAHLLIYQEDGSKVFREVVWSTVNIEGVDRMKATFTLLDPDTEMQSIDQVFECFKGVLLNDEVKFDYVSGDTAKTVLTFRKVEEDFKEGMA